MKNRFIVSLNRYYVEYFEDFETYEEALHFFNECSNRGEAFPILIFDNIDKKFIYFNDFLDEDDLENEIKIFLENLNK